MIFSSRYRFKNQFSQIELITNKKLEILLRQFSYAKLQIFMSLLNSAPVCQVDLITLSLDIYNFFLKSLDRPIYLFVNCVPVPPQPGRDVHI